MILRVLRSRSSAAANSIFNSSNIALCWLVDIKRGFEEAECRLLQRQAVTTYKSFWVLQTESFSLIILGATSHMQFPFTDSSPRKNIHSLGYFSNEVEQLVPK